MQAKKLTALLHMVQHMDELVLHEIATMPEHMMKDSDDRTIVTVARGEQDWRTECQK